METSKIDASLLLVLQDRSRMEKLHDPHTASAARAALPFVVEVAADGRLLVPIFVQTAVVADTSKAIGTLGGSVSTVVGNRIVARVPLEAIPELARRADVQRIEASQKARPVR